MIKKLHESGFGRGRRVLLAVLSYLFLLAMSYGFPVTGDDWFFSPKHITSFRFLDPFIKGWDIAAHHYITTNGRLLGNFLVTFLCFSKLLRELVRCGIILGVLLYLFRLSGGRGLTHYLLCFALLIAMPARIVAQSYTWAAGFCNYVPPTLLLLCWLDHLQGCFCGEKPRHGLGWILAMLLLGFASQLFLENFSLGLCVLSAAGSVLVWVRRKRPEASLLAHLLGAVAGCIVMFCAPGYQNVGREGYREISLSLGAMLEVMEENFKTLSGFLTAGNFLVIVPLCAAGAAVCLRSLQGQRAQRPLLLRLCLLAYCCYPLLVWGVHHFGRYYLAVDLAANAMLFTALILTALFCLESERDRFVLIGCAVSFLVLIAPLMIVTPVGARNAYLFDVLFILMTMILLRLAIQDLPALRPMYAAVCLMCCLLLAGNLHIHLRNGQTEQLRKQITQEAMDRGDSSITLPGYPYKAYIHGDNQQEAISSYYYYDNPGDITFFFDSYENWVKTH